MGEGFSPSYEFRTSPSPILVPPQVSFRKRRRRYPEPRGCLRGLRLQPLGSGSSALCAFAGITRGQCCSVCTLAVLFGAVVDAVEFVEDGAYGFDEGGVLLCEFYTQGAEAVLHLHRTGAKVGDGDEEGFEP